MTFEATWSDLSRQYRRKARALEPLGPIMKEAIDVKKKAYKEGVTLGRSLLLKAIENVERFIPEAGIHIHRLDRDGKKSLFDGRHTHLFILPDGTTVITEDDGGHEHMFGSEIVDIVTESGGHVHKIIMPDGSELTTKDDGTGIHDHQLLVRTSAYDGIHIHTLVLADGTEIESLWPGEFWDVLSETPDAVSSFDLSDDLAKSLPQKIRDGDPGNPVLDDALQDSLINKADGYEPFQQIRLQKPAFATPVMNVPLIDLDEPWAWSQVRLPVGVHPVMVGRRGIMEKKGNQARIWYEDEFGVDRLGDYLEEKAAVLAVEHDFSAEIYAVPNGDSFKIFLFDLLYWGQDLTPLGFEDRRKHLINLHTDNFTENSRLGLLDVRWINSISELDGAVKWAIAPGFSNGALLKSAGGQYELNTAQTGWYGLPEEMVVVEKEDDTLIAAALGFNVKESQPEIGEPLRICKEQVKPKPDTFEKEVKVQILKADEEQRFVLGVVLEPLEVDAQTDIIIPREIEKTAWAFLADHRVVGLRHKIRADAKVVESYIARVDFELDGEKVKKGSWLLGVIIDDLEIWEAVKNFDINAFSIGGFARRTELK